MKRQFILNIVLLVLLNVLIKPFWVLGIDRTIQNVLGAHAYGLYFALFNFTILFNVLLDLGITNFNNRSIAQNPGLVNKYFPRLLFIKLFLGITYLIICLGAALLMGYKTMAFKLTAILGVNQLLASMLLFMRSNISGLQLFTTDSFLSVLDRFLMIIFSSLLLWTHIFPVGINIYVFALTQTLAYALSCGIAGIILMKKNGGIRFKGVPIFSASLLRKSVPYALLGILMVIYNRIDAVILERLLPDGARAAGIYAQSYRIFDAINMVSVIFASLLLPMFAKQIANKESIRPLIKLAFSILFSGTVVLAIHLIVFAKPVLAIMYNEYFPESAGVFALLMFSIIPVALSYIYGTLLTADGRVLALNFIAGITLACNVLLNLFLIPRYGVMGAAVTALVSQLLVAFSQMYVCKKYFKIGANVKSAGMYCIFFLISFVLAKLFYNIGIGIFWELLLSLLLSAGIAFVLKIISLKELVEAFKAEGQ